MRFRRFILVLVAVMAASSGIAAENLSRRLERLNRDLKNLRQNSARPEDFCDKMWKLEHEARAIASAAFAEGDPKISGWLSEAAQVLRKIRYEAENDPAYFYLERKYAIRRTLRRIESRNAVALDRLDVNWVN